MINIEEKLKSHQEEFTPDESFKKETLAKIKLTNPKEQEHRLSFFKRKLFPMLLTFSILIVVSISIGLISLNAEEYESVYIDSSSSVELCLNRFDKVVNVKYHDAESEEILSNESYKGLTLEDAVNKIVDKLDQYCEYVTINISSKSDKKTEELNNDITDIMEKKDKTDSSDVGEISHEDLDESKEHGLLPSVYKIISSIIDLDDSYSLDDLKDLSIRQLIEIYHHLKNDK